MESTIIAKEENSNCILKIDYLDNYLTFDKDFLECAQTLKGRFKLAILSNDVSEWSEYLTKNNGIKDYFDVSIISGNVGCRKPDCSIYESMLEKLNCPPEECLFIDNTVKNLITAENLGMDTVLFNRDNESFHGKIVYSFKELGDLLAV